ncbi:MAG: YggS family pyridoxal phosphate-dependent enzyme [bacterium]
MLRENWQIVKEKAAKAAISCNRLPEDIKIIAVSKTKPVEMVYAAIEAGMNLFGENYAQELQSKYMAFKEKQIQQPEWHFIGTLQRNNAKYIVPFATMIHSVDSGKLADEINKRAAENNRIIDCLLQVNTSGEYSKSGEDPDQILDLAKEVMRHKNLNVKGLMSIGSFTEDEVISRNEFKILRDCLSLVNAKLGIDLKELSMGMTHDFHIAIEEGATMVRVGTAIFGNRLYSK